MQITQKAKILRELTLNFELIANHFKWFYLTIYPLIMGDTQIKKAINPSKIISEAIAILAGQYPHNSYAIVGGLTGEITPIDIFEVKQRLKAIRRLFREYIIDSEIEKFSRCEKLEQMLSRDGDLPLVMKKILDNSWQNLGQSYDRFILFGDSYLFKSGKSIGTRYQEYLDIRYIEQFKSTNSEAFERGEIDTI